MRAIYIDGAYGIPPNKCAGRGAHKFEGALHFERAQQPPEGLMMNYFMLARRHNADVVQGQRHSQNATGLTIKFCFCKRRKFVMVQVIKLFYIVAICI